MATHLNKTEAVLVKECFNVLLGVDDDYVLKAASKSANYSDPQANLPDLKKRITEKVGGSGMEVRMGADEG